MVKFLKIQVGIFLIVVVFLNHAIKVGSIECSINAKLTTEQQINEFDAQCVKPLGQKITTLAQQIQYMNSQIYLTTVQINQTEQKIISFGKEIDLLGSRIEGLDQSLGYLSKQLIQRIVIGYKKKPFTIFSLLFDNKNANDFLNQLKYLKTAQDNTQKLLYSVQETKANAEEQKKLREEKKVELDRLQTTLESQKVDLNNQQAAEKRLLAETQNDESTYQSLVTQARAQLAGFGRFVSNQGGASILSNQTVCDDWGCYYNQRDSQWGGIALNNTGYTLAGEGCLVTAMAMIYTHFGHRSVTPQTINSNSQNFASYYTAYLNKTIMADGTSSTRISANIDSELSTGRPVVVGISYDGGPSPDHFLVLISGSNGNYLMNDPFTPNGHNIPFTDHYSVGSIREIDRISM